MTDLKTNTVPVKCTVSAEEVNRVKGLGFLRDKTTPDCFNGRVITRNGKITAEESIHIAEAARKFGSGEVAMTTRQTVEIQRVPYENIAPLCDFLAEKGLETGGTGPKVRPVVSCKGTTCVFGLIDTFAISEEIHERFYKAMHDVKLPHKFKIAVGGCPNNCVKPDLNDIGIIGQRKVKYDNDRCRGCGVCQLDKVCPMKAVKAENGRIVVDEKLCNNCGRCYRKCPFGVSDDAESGCIMTIGGRWGKKAGRGYALGKMFTDTGDLMNAIEKTILWFRDNGEAGERFRDTIDRIGFDRAEEELLK